jgi:hypothetical protein
VVGSCECVNEHKMCRIFLLVEHTVCYLLKKDTVLWSDLAS